ncbi:MAG TPA: amidohydrolase [Streptosporangiaceae bacterium]|nr:amidohydrolase [Streptosporangiaceae bacterium]
MPESVPGSRTGDLTATHHAIDAAMAGLDGRLRELSLELHAHPEPALAEHHSAGLLREWLAGAGFRVAAPVAGLDTAFVAEYGQGSPVIAYLAEYDALPGVGHGCGHNLIAAGGIGAATALMQALPEPPGTLRVIGTPGEEGAGGKVIELEAGVFDDVDAALMFHPGDKTVPIRHALASMPMTFEFHGIAAHAAGSPADGRSALAGVIQLFVSIDALRLFLPETSRIHGVILDGGLASNVIPDYTRASFQVRAVTSELLAEHVDRVVACAEAAALATGTTVDITRGHVYAERKNNHAIAYRVARYLTELGEEVEVPVLRGGTGSSDIGNVSLRLPAIHPYMKVMPSGTPGHSHAMTEAVAGIDAHRAMLRMATALAKTGADLFCDGALLEKARREFAVSGPDLPD